VYLKLLDPIVSTEVSTMHERLRQFLQQAVEVVVSAGRWIVLSLPVIWLVTGVIFHFSCTWLWVVTTVMSIVTLLVVLLLLTTQDRHISALSRKLHHLERAIKQREVQVESTIKKMHRGQLNGRDGEDWHDR